MAIAEGGSSCRRTRHDESGPAADDPKADAMTINEDMVNNLVRSFVSDLGAAMHVACR
jgi:hypothetical protein